MQPLSAKRLRSSNAEQSAASQSAVFQRTASLYNSLKYVLERQLYKALCTEQSSGRREQNRALDVQNRALGAQNRALGALNRALGAQIRVLGAPNGAPSVICRHQSGL